MLAGSTTIRAFAQTLLPRGEVLTGITDDHLQRAMNDLSALHPALPKQLHRVCVVLDQLARLKMGSRFLDLSDIDREQVLKQWLCDSRIEGSIVSALMALLKLYYFDGPEQYERYGVPHDKAPKQTEPLPRYFERAIVGSSLDEEVIEADVVVIGSGAAGAVVGKELAQQGHAVIVVEAGSYFRRDRFKGQALDAMKTFFEWRPRNVVIGNIFLPLPAGKTVGGSTTVNTATCFRPRAWIFDRWVREGLRELSEAKMAPYFADLERTLHVAPVAPHLWGNSVERMAHVADRRGLSHGPILRNAPECIGMNTCDTGCPAGAKLSMDLSYIPSALRYGALLLTETVLTKLVIRDHVIRGAIVESHGKRLHLKASKVVLACGALATPQILWQHDLGGPAVGKNLTFHPSPSVAARMKTPVHGFGTLVPSPYFIDLGESLRLLFIAANLPLDFGAMPLQLLGHDLIAEMERFEYLANWGILLEETSRGRLVRGPRGEAITHYHLNSHDMTRIQEGMALLCELYFDAGAEICFPSLRSWSKITSRSHLQDFRRATLNASELVLSAWHPLGTCRMGTDSRTSVVDSEYRVRDVDGLYLVDGSVVPGPIGVNSQLTVMAFARRAADILHAHLG